MTCAGIILALFGVNPEVGTARVEDNVEVLGRIPNAYLPDKLRVHEILQLDFCVGQIRHGFLRSPRGTQKADQVELVFVGLGDAFELDSLWVVA